MAAHSQTAGPQPAVGVVVFRKDKILLVKRANQPGKGLWAIPGGRIKLGETLRQAAEREVREETGILIKPKESISVFEVIERDENNTIRFHYVIVDLLAEYLSGELSPGTDASEARWVTSGQLKRLAVTKSTRQLLQSRFQFG